MQNNTRTPMKQANRANTYQASQSYGNQARTSSIRTSGASGTQATTGNQNSVNLNTTTAQSSIKKQPKDKLGQAVVSMIFGIFGIIFFIIAILKMGYDSTHSYTTSAGTAITGFLAFVLNLFGFFLGIGARRSSKGRGMAIAGITLTVVPFVVMTVFFVGGIIMNLIMWG